jgi:hypothetical protein
MIQPGQIDYQEQLDSLRDLPVNEQSIEYLTGLSRDPGSPFVRFLVESRLEQLTKALQNQAGAQAQENAPQGTISDRIQQAAGLAALQAGQQRQAAEQMREQASQAPMPVPQGIAQPQAQAEPDYGIASAPMDSEMFNFAPGGIVTFANPEKEKKQLVKDEEEAKAKQREADRRALLEPLAAVGDIVQLPVAAGYNLLADAAGGTEGFLNRIGSALTGENVNTQTDGQVGGKFRFSPTPFTDMLRQPTSREAAQQQAQQAVIAADPESQKLANLAATPPSAQNMNPALQPNKNVPPPPPPPPTNVKPSAPPAPPAASATAGIETLINQMYNMPERNKFGQLINEARANMVTTPQSKLIEDELELQKTLGIGTFAKQQQQMYEDNKARQAKIEAGRGQRDFRAQLAAYSRPGANWSQVVERDIANKSAALMEDERFANAQNKLLTDIQATAEAQRVGTASTVRAAKAKEKETREKMLDLIMRLTGDDAKIAQSILGDTLKAAVSTYGSDLQYRASMANTAAIANSKAEKLLLDREKQILRNNQSLQQIEARNQDLLNKNPDYKGYVKIRQGLEQNLNYITDEAKRAKTLEQIDGYNQKISEIATRIIGGGGGGISTLPQQKSTSDIYNPTTGKVEPRK